MKRYILSLIAIMMILSACKKDAVHKSLNPNKTPVTFKLGFTQSTGSFNGGANVISSKLNAQNMSKLIVHTLAADTALTKYASVIMVGLYASDGTKISLTKQLSTDTAFGRINFNLSPGNYTVTFAAGQSGLNENGNMLNATTMEYDTTLNSERIHTWKNTFFQKINITVGSRGIDQSVTLSRIDSEIILNIEDAVPANVKYIAFVANDDAPYSLYDVGTGNLSPGSGLGTVFAGTSPTTALTPGVTNIKLCVPVLDVSNRQFQLQIFAYDQLPTINLNSGRIFPSFNGNRISYYISNTVTVQQGHQTVLSGKLFGGNGLTNTGGFQMTVDPQWSTVTTTIPFQ